MFHSPIGRVLSFVISIVAVAAVGLVVIKPALDRATGSASKTVTTGNGTASTDLFAPGEFQKATAEIERKVEGNPQLLEVGVYEGFTRFTYFDRPKDGAYGFEWRDNTVRDVKVQVSGSGSLKQNAFPQSMLDPRAPARIAAALDDRVKGDPVITSLTLKRVPVTLKVTWTGAYENGSRTGLVFQARPSGGGLKLIG